MIPGCSCVVILRSTLAREGVCHRRRSVDRCAVSIEEGNDSKDFAPRGQGLFPQLGFSPFLFPFPCPSDTSRETAEACLYSSEDTQNRKTLVFRE